MPKTTSPGIAAPWGRFEDRHRLEKPVYFGPARIEWWGSPDKRRNWSGLVIEAEPKGISVGVAGLDLLPGPRSEPIFHFIHGLHLVLDAGSTPGFRCLGTGSTEPPDSRQRVWPACRNRRSVRESRPYCLRIGRPGAASTCSLPPSTTSVPLTSRVCTPTAG